MFRSLLLSQFRNLKKQSVNFGANVNIFVGENGQGKTNLLEALYLSATGESFRYSENTNFIEHEKPEAYIHTKLISNDLSFDLKLQILKSKKNILLNSKRATTAQLRSQFPIIVFSPESLSAIKEGDDQRRLLVDELLIVTHPSNAQIIVDYRKSLKTRNKILRDFSDKKVSYQETQDLLDSINPIFFRLASELTYRRIKAIRNIHPLLNTAMQYIINKQDVDISVEYVISGENALKFELNQVSDSLRQRAIQLKEAELSSGSSLIGPHKHDIKFLYNQNDSRFYCSQGQQRALILSFKMAQIVYHRTAHGIYPVLMLDDVLSELDTEKRNSLIKFLGDIKTQIFLTTTDFDLPGSLNSEDATVLKVREGQIEL